jgi:hypothetical protein
MEGIGAATPPRKKKFCVPDYVFSWDQTNLKFNYMFAIQSENLYNYVRITLIFYIDTMNLISYLELEGKKLLCQSDERRIIHHFSYFRFQAVYLVIKRDLYTDLQYTHMYIHTVFFYMYSAVQQR